MADPLPFEERVNPALFRARFRSTVLETGILHSTEPLVALVDAYAHEGAVHLFSDGDRVDVRIRAFGWMEATVSAKPFPARLFVNIMREIPANWPGFDPLPTLYWIHNVVHDVAPPGTMFMKPGAPSHVALVNHAGSAFLLNLPKAWIDCEVADESFCEVPDLTTARTRFPELMGEHWTGPAGEIVAGCDACSAIVLHPNVAAVGVAEDIPLGKYLVPHLCRACFEDVGIRRRFEVGFRFRTKKTLAFPRGLEPLPPIADDERAAFEAHVGRLYRDLSHLYLPKPDRNSDSYFEFVGRLMHLEGKDRETAVECGFLSH